ncbi:hypothetical protein BDA99DRAFT_539184 [Phascolomyces articulosus]|uniref:Uncharacterized protein n=1 Tax=Phascolomyces articulosus TaxID=60185 RepID=A0AAD5PCK9_9FUNG|nr:hypothetical protein BDA99DRAFT_539184 [Phascolomyces articulosus]
MNQELHVFIIRVGSHYHIITQFHIRNSIIKKQDSYSLSIVPSFFFSNSHKESKICFNNNIYSLMCDISNANATDYRNFEHPAVTKIHLCGWYNSRFDPFMALYHFNHMPLLVVCRNSSKYRFVTAAEKRILFAIRTISLKMGYLNHHHCYK